MNANAVAKLYGNLTPEERFRLILAASARDDEFELDRLTNAGRRIALSMADHAPFADGFNELALLTFIELQEEAARYQECFVNAGDIRDIFGADEEDASEKPACLRTLDIALAAGYVLRTKANGWKLFCEQLNVPPFLFWEKLPGFDRLQRALALAEKAAFVPEEFLRWLNRVRPKGKPEVTAVPLTVAGMADATAEVLREFVKCWGG